MDENKAIDIITKAYSNSITREEVYEILYSYCICKGKPSLASEIFVKTVIAFGIDIELIQYIIDYYTKKYQLIILRNKEGKFIKVLKNEEINSKTICCCEENSSHSEPSDNQEGQTCRKD